MVEWMPCFSRTLIKLRTNHWKTLQLVTAREVWLDCVSFLNKAFSFRLKSWEELLELGRMGLPLMVHILFSGLNSELFTTFFLHLWMHFRFYQCAKYSVILMEVQAQLWYLQIPHISSAHCYFASLNFDELIPECHYLLPELRIRNTEHCLCAVKLPQKHWWSRGQPSESHRSVGLLAVFDSLCHGRLRPPGFQR